MATRHTFAGSTQHFNGAGEEGRQGQGGMMEQVSSAGHAIQSQAQHYVEDYPLSTVLTVFGIGLGVGVVLGSSLMSSRSSSDWSSGSSSWLPSSSSSWLPSMSSSSSSWMPSSSHSWMPSGSQSSWFGSSQPHSSWFSSSQPHSWSDSLMRGAKNMFGGSSY